VKPIFKTGDKKHYTRVVTENDVAAFHGEVVHPVCSTFSIARDVEWTTRQFVLEMRDNDEEGVGTFVNIEHKSPAFVGEEIIYTGIVEKINGHELICSFVANVGERLIAQGQTGQKILKREKINKIFQKA
jgi:fluoroacetyl-CoA thioesterase